MLQNVQKSALQYHHSPSTQHGGMVDYYADEVVNHCEESSLETIFFWKIEFCLRLQVSFKKLLPFILRLVL